MSESEKKNEKKTDLDGSSSLDPMPGNAGSSDDSEITRRKLFERGAVTVGGLAGAVIGLPAIGFAIGPVFKAADVYYSPVGPADQFSSDTYTTKVIRVSEGVGEAGKTTVYVRKTDPKIDPAKVGEFIAISTGCTHLGCPVRYIEASASFICPCHTSAFDFQGFRITGPAVRPLDRFDTKVVNGELLIGPRFSVNDQLDRFNPRHPGERLSPSFWKYLYPRRFSTAPFN